MSQVAGDAQIPQLAAALKDLETREMARWALQRIPSPAATAALIAALSEVGPDFLIGVINALGDRPSPDVNAATLKAASNPDVGVRLAAIEALAKSPELSNDEPIVAVIKTTYGRNRGRAEKARCRLADTLRLAGKKDAAVSVYKAILANDAPEPQKKAARIALEQLT